MYVPGSAFSRDLWRVRPELEASGVVDAIEIWDQLTLIWPRSSGAPKTPLRRGRQGQRLVPDVFVRCPYVAAMTERLGITVTADAVRTFAGGIMQTMLTLAAAGRGAPDNFVSWVPGRPAVHAVWLETRRRVGRAEDHLRLYRLLWEAESPSTSTGTT